MSGTDDVPGWSENIRSDGAIVTQRDDGTFRAWPPPPNATKSIAYCPHCGAAITSARAAKLVCNAVHPIATPS